MGLFGNLFGSKKVDEDVDNYPTNNDAATSGDFYFIVEDVFSIIGRGIVVTGRVNSGTVHLGDTVFINGSTSTVVTGIEMFRKNLDYAQAGDNCGLLLKDINRDDINKGDSITK